MKRLLCLLAVAAPLLAQPWPLTDSQPAPAPGRRERPRVAAGAHGFLAAWSDFRFAHDVWGTRFDDSGRAVASVHVAADADLHALASDGDGYLAVVAPIDCDGIDAIPIDANGVVHAATHIADTLPCPLQASAASNGSSYLVVYTARFEERMRIALFDRDGRRLRGPLPLAAPHLGAFAAGSNGRGYLVALNGTAIPIDANGNAAAPHKTGANDFASVALAPHGDGYLLTTGSPVTTQPLAADGTPAGAPHVVQARQSFDVSVAWTGSGYAAAWTVFSREIATTMATARLDADGAPVEVAPDVESAPEPLEPVDVAAARGVTLVVRETPDQQIFAAELLSLSAAPQLRPRTTSIPGGAAVAWIEDGRVRLRLLDASGHPAGAVAITNLNGAHQAAFDGTNIVVAAFDQHVISAQRFTTSLQPIDAQPIPIVAATATDFALAAANGTALFAWNDGANITAALLQDGRALPLPTLATDNDGSLPSATWDGSSFVVAYSRRAPPALAAVRVDANAVLSPTTTIADLDSPAIRSAIAPAPGGLFAAWRTFGIAARIFGTPARVLSPPGAVEGPFLAGDTVAWTLATDLGLTLQWRTFSGDAIASLTPQPRLAALDPSIVAIGGNVFAAYERYDEAAGGVPRIVIETLPKPRPHAAVRR